jgi:hypothetical protein
MNVLEPQNKHTHTHTHTHLKKKKIEPVSLIRLDTFDQRCTTHLQIYITWMGQKYRTNFQLLVRAHEREALYIIYNKI